MLTLEATLLYNRTEVNIDDLLHVSVFTPARNYSLVMQLILVLLCI